MVHVGWLRPLVTKLLPSTMNKFGTSWARWFLSTTDVLWAFPMRQVPIRCPAHAGSSSGEAHFFVPPAASSSSIDRSVKNFMVLSSSGWHLYVIRNAGRPHASCTSGSRLMLFDSSGRQVVWPYTVIVRLKFSIRAFLNPAPQRGTSGGNPYRAKLIG